MAGQEDKKKARMVDSDKERPPSQTHLTTGLLYLWQTRAEANIIVRIDGREIPCHKAVLMAASPYFQAMFTSGMKEAIAGEIDLKEMTAETFELILEFMYTGNNIVTVDNVSSVIEASALLQIQALFEKCEDTLIDNITVETCWETWRLASVFNSEKVRDKAFEHILSKFETVIDSEYFTELNTDDLLEIVKDDRLEVPSEEVVVKAVLRWGQCNEEHKSDVGSIFSNLRLCQLSFEYLHELKIFFTTTLDSEIARNSITLAIELKTVPSKMQRSSSKIKVYRHCSDFEEVMVAVGFFNIFVFSFQQKKWFRLTEFPDEDGVPLQSAFCSNRNSIFFTGGEERNHLFLEYKAVDNKWIEHESLSTGRVGHSMVAMSNALFMFGGMSDAQQSLNTVIEKYSFNGKKWNDCGSLVKPVNQASTAVIGNTIYVLGGVSSNIQYFDVALNTTTLVNLQSFPKFVIHSIVQVEDIIYTFDEGVCYKFNVEKMTFETVKTVGFQLELNTHIFHGNGTFYIISENGELIAFDPLTGKHTSITEQQVFDVDVQDCAKLVIHKQFLQRAAI